ncbi:MAG: hypothetical protein JXB62_06580 [Pirellulales bacterium]|nr:hypothetical protein [Pirellulales bacterium]
MSMSSSGWKEFFRQWPAELPRRGVVITTFGEQIPFAEFLTSSKFLLLERHAPDSLGARTVVVPFDAVAALKLTDVVKSKTFASLGFERTAV